jgi:hypothetical protein
MVTKEIVKSLGTCLKSKISELAAVTEDFPESNEKLSYPSISITGSNPTTTPCSPYIFTQGAAVENDSGGQEAQVKWVTGQHEFKLQLDLWCRSKEERHKLFQALTATFSSQFPVMGLSLQLSGYHGVWARYDVTATGYEDSEIASQRREWRAIFTVAVNCLAIYETVENVIGSTDVFVEAADMNENF